jgi:hypothetical protein
VERHKRNKTEFAPQWASRTDSKYFAYIFKLQEAIQALQTRAAVARNQY